MSNHFDTLLAKGERNGKTTLIEHISHVIAAIEKIAASTNLDPVVARMGAVLHDLGKAHPAFQAKLVQDRFDYLELKTEIPLRHEISSILFLPLFPKEHWNSLIEMVIGHHKSVKAQVSNSNKNGLLDLINDFSDMAVFQRHCHPWDSWSESALQIIKYFGYETRQLSISEAQEAFDYTIQYCENEILDWSKWRGLLSSSDHFASALTGQTQFQINRTFQNPNLDFFFNNNRHSNLYPLSMLRTDDVRPHTLVIAPTGAGKTDFLIKRCKNRIFYTLPFQASINAMYKRIKSVCPNDDIRVLHASSRLIIDKNDNIYEEKLLQPLMGASVKVLTPYQIASVAFGTKGFEAIALDLCGNDVILDEIHSYTEISMSIVYEIIKALLKLNCNIHIGSATMPTQLQNSIFELLGGDTFAQKVTLPNSVLNTFNRHITHKINSFDNSIDIIKKAVADNQKILIVCNRINLAQERFEIIRNLFPTTPKMLLHSRYKRTDRASLEDKIKKEFDENEGPCIVVSTQVVEVSLDISFDLLITDAAPLDSLIQRFGRINRRRNDNTIGIYKCVYIIKPSEKKNDVLPYDFEIVTKSFDALSDNSLLEETEIQNLLDVVYPTVNIGTLDSHSILSVNGYKIPKLCDYPKSILLDMMDIETASCVTFSDIENYTIAKSDDKKEYEIPISPKSVFNKKLKIIDRLQCGSWPFVINDELYNSEVGLVLKEVSNIL